MSGAALQKTFRAKLCNRSCPNISRKRSTKRKLIPVTRPEVNDIHFKEGEPLKFRAVFEVLPEFDLGDYKNLSVQVDEIQVGDEQVDKTLEEMRERSATYVPVEGRAAKDGDYVLIKLMGVPVGGGDPVQADNILCHLGGEETLESFTENLRGANPGEKKDFESALSGRLSRSQAGGKDLQLFRGSAGHQGKEAARTERRIRERCRR